MARVDTGLGWSGNSGYLVLSDAILASFGGILSWTLSGWEPNHLPVIPAAPSVADIMTNGVLWASVYNNDQSRHKEVYAASDSPGTIMFLSVSTGNEYAWRGYALGRENAKVWILEITDGVPGTVSECPMSTYPISPNIYFTQTVRSSGTWRYALGTYSVPRYDISNLNDQSALLNWALANSALSTPLSISKLNVGYAAACVVIYNTVYGLRTTPVLISNERNLVQYVYTGTYSEQETSHLLDGMRFYMRVITDITDPLAASSVPVIDLHTGPIVTSDVLFRGIVGPSYANIQITGAPPDPYEQEGGDSGADGGNGEDTEDDENGIEVNSDFPSAINTGFCRIYCPSQSQLQALSNYLWSNSYDLTQVKKLFSNPMDSVIGLSAVPIQLSGTSVNFSLGGVIVPDMTLPMVSQQRYTYYMGGITVKERWGSYLDYDPYTKFSIFLPFIGMRELSTDDIMGKQVMLYYDIDILSGICTARLQAGKHCLYEWGGSCALQLPINSRNWDSVFNTAVGAVSGIVSAVSGGAAPLVAGSVASAALQSVSMKPRVDKSGTVSGASGWLGQMTPYLIRTTPEAYIPASQNAYIGYPSYMSVSLGSISGYNEIDSIHLENIPATGDELAELESILKGGVIF